MPEPRTAGEISSLLIRWQSGDKEAFAELVPLVYDELRRISERHLRRRREQSLLQPTALVHEMWLKISRKQSLPLDSRPEFFALASRIMRDVLTDHVRAGIAARRGGTKLRVTIGPEDVHQDSRLLDFLVLNEALDRLAQIKARYTQLIEMRFFAGMSMDEAAAALHVSTATLEREWRVARSWLQREVTRGPTDDPGRK